MDVVLLQWLYGSRRFETTYWSRFEASKGPKGLRFWYIGSSVTRHLASQFHIPDLIPVLSVLNKERRSIKRTAREYSPVNLKNKAHCRILAIKIIQVRRWSLF
jgi:hypothetical protein